MSTCAATRTRASLSRGDGAFGESEETAVILSAGFREEDRGSRTAEKVRHDLAFGEEGSGNVYMYILYIW